MTGGPKSHMHQSKLLASQAHIAQHLVHSETTLCVKYAFVSADRVLEAVAPLAIHTLHLSKAPRQHPTECISRRSSLSIASNTQVSAVLRGQQPRGRLHRWQRGQALNNRRRECASTALPSQIASRRKSFIARYGGGIHPPGRFVPGTFYRAPTQSIPAELACCASHSAR